MESDKQRINELMGYFGASKTPVMLRDKLKETLKEVRKEEQNNSKYLKAHNDNVRKEIEQRQSEMMELQRKLNVDKALAEVMAANADKWKARWETLREYFTDYIDYFNLPKRVRMRILKKMQALESIPAKTGNGGELSMTSECNRKENGLNGVLEKPKPGGFCEVCWSNAFSRMIANPSKSQTEHYEDLIKELSLPFGGNPHKVEPKPVGLYNPIKAIEEDGGNPEGWKGKPKPDSGKEKA